MQRANYITKPGLIMVIGIIAAMMACRKNGAVLSVPAPAAFTVVNAIPYSINVIPVINTSSAIKWFKSSKYFGYGSFFEYSPLAGNDTVYAVQGKDTLRVGTKGSGSGLLYYGILPLKEAGIYSLFLTGTDTSHVDFVFTTDTLSYHSPADSTFGVRFINLSTGSNPISIDIKGKAAGSEVGRLPYKGTTSFRNYTASSKSPSSYVFEFRDAVTGNLLNSTSTITLSGILNGVGSDMNANTYRFRNFTIALIGVPGGTGSVAQKAILINNY